MTKKKTQAEEINEELDKLERERQERIKAGKPRKDDDYATGFFGFFRDEKKKDSSPK